MRNFYRLLTALVLLLCAMPLRAQWSGSADVSVGLGGIKGSIISEDDPMFHGLAEGVFQLNYKKTEKFTWSTTVKGKWEPKTTDNSRAAYKNQRLNVTYKAATTKPLSGSLKSDFAWRPSPLRNYSAWIFYQYKNDQAFNHSLNFDGTEQQMENLSYYNEVPTLNEHKVEGGFKSFRSFDSGRSILRSSLTAVVVAGQRVNVWTVFKTGDDGKGTAVEIEDVKGYARKYRITPFSGDLKLDGDIHLQRTLRDDNIKLSITPGARLALQNNLDENSGATVVNVSLVDGAEEVWRDSTRLRETFDYVSLRAEPYMKADFRWQNLEAHADYSPQVFARRLNDDTHQQPLKIKGVFPVGNANVKWNISPMHSLTLSNKMSVAHPDYIKICWYDRSAGYLDQLYRGNEQLKSPQTRQYTLEYGFKYKRFSTFAGVTYKRVEDEIDQTWSNEEIDGRQYKVFRWINSADSHSAELTGKLSWKGKIITANAAITYNQAHRVSKSSGAEKYSFDWKLTSDVTARLGKGWSLGYDVKYQSKTATFFTIFNQYCQLNAFVQKEFKHITVYLKGKDLLDTPVKTQFESDELKEYWEEEVRNNRRIVILGVKWKF